MQSVFKKFPPKKNRAVYAKMWKKYGTAKQAIDGSTVLLMGYACWITR
jgi:hypothetical protein